LCYHQVKKAAPKEKAAPKPKAAAPAPKPKPTVVEGSEDEQDEEGPPSDDGKFSSIFLLFSHCFSLLLSFSLSRVHEHSAQPA
jgi:hypothetical protein